MAKRNKSNKILEFEEILKRIKEGELEPVHYNGNSPAWKIFNKIRYVKEKTKFVDYAQCKTCKILYTFTPENGTSTLKKHTCKNAKDEVVYKDISPDEAIEVKNNLLQKSMEFCAKDTIPADILSGTGFLNFSQALVAIGERHGYIKLANVLPKKGFLNRHIQNSIDDEQNKCKASFTEALKKNYCSLSITCHAKVDGNSQFIANFICFDNDLTKLTRKIICTWPIDEDYNAEKIVSDIQNKFKALGCDEKTLKNITVVTSRKNIFMETLAQICSRVDCAAFVINSILQPFVDSEEISEIFQNCKAIVSYLIESGKETKLKFKVVEDINNWERKISMIHKLNLNYTEVMSLLSPEKQENFKFNQKLAEELVEVLEVFVDALDDLQSTNYPTCNRILLWWSILNDHFNSNAKYSKPMKRTMLHAKLLFEKNFVPTINQKISCFLDPRYRFLKMLSLEDRIEVIREVRQILDDLLYEPCNAVPLHSAGPPAKKSKFSHLEANDDDVEERDEVNVYLHSTQLSSYNLVESEMNIISKFWKKNEAKLPKLFRLATSKLHIPACCCSREKTINLNRSIEANTFDELLCIKDSF